MEYRRSESNLGRSRRSPYTIAEILKNLLIIIQVTWHNHELFFSYVFYLIFFKFPKAILNFSQKKNFSCFGCTHNTLDYS